MLAGPDRRQPERGPDSGRGRQGARAATVALAFKSKLPCAERRDSELDSPRPAVTGGSAAAYLVEAQLPKPEPERHTSTDASPHPP